MNDTTVTDVKPYADSPLNRMKWVVPLAAILSGFSLFEGLKGHRHFVDESAYVSQAYFGDLFLTGQVNSSLWFEYPAYDLPPLTKYLVWAGLVAGGDARPGPAAMRAWYRDTSSRFESPEMLMHARLPIIYCSIVTLLAVGLLAEGWLGAGGAVLAIFFVNANPLFRSHARQAMADIPTEMGVVAALCLFAPKAGRLFGSYRRAVACGIFLGLAASAKLNGFLASIVVVVWSLMCLIKSPRIVLHLSLAGLCGAILFILLNPFLYANPNGLREPQFEELRQKNLPERLKFMMDHRVGVSQEGQKLFPKDAVTTIPQKIRVIIVQGFGRFSPLGPLRDNSERRYDPAQDWPEIFWLPLVVWGLRTALVEKSQANVSARFMIIYWVCAIVVVGAFLPLAWNRYMLPLVIPSSILAAGGTIDLYKRLVIRSQATKELPA